MKVIKIYINPVRHGIPFAVAFSEDIRVFFMRFGTVTVDWPHKSHSRGSIPPKGICCMHISCPQDYEIPQVWQQV